MATINLASHIPVSDGVIDKAPEKSIEYTAEHLEDLDKEACEVLENGIDPYQNPDDEPTFHWRTWVALAAMFFLNFVQVIALQGPPVVLTNIGQSLNNPATQSWVPSALSLVQGVLSPIISSASDTFQARKPILMGCCLIAFIGSAIAPGSQNIYRLIAAQTLIGFGFASVTIAYCVPSEILPRKWRAMVQSVVNIAAALGACVGPLMIGALTRNDPVNGWRTFYWIQMAFWGVTAAGTYLGYRPPKQRTIYSDLSLKQKILCLDLVGLVMFMVGLTLFLVALNLGGGLARWTSARVLVTLILGLVILIAFTVYEWKTTGTAMVHHDLFRGGRNAGRSYAIFLVLIFIEGIMLFAYMLFYPIMTTNLFTTDPFLLAAREQPLWIAGGLSTVFWGYWSIRARSIRVPLFTGFLIFTAGIVGLATIQPSDSTNACIFAGLCGIGFGAPLVLIIAGVQLATPHALIATGTALITSSRAVSSAIFTAIFNAILTQRLNRNIPDHVSRAVLAAGLPHQSLGQFLDALLAKKDAVALGEIPGVTSRIIVAANDAMKQAFADSVRIIFIIAAASGVLACVFCLCLGDQSKNMTYRVDAPVEELDVKDRQRDKSAVVAV
ncbi:hypothetical protein AbraIFM66950_009645 [Aspergillus brasiliensis]|nr:hypothetical protein AbraIFM66950_009645 [Aspergillus brasiliensis]